MGDQEVPGVVEDDAPKAGVGLSAAGGRGVGHGAGVVDRENRRG